MTSLIHDLAQLGQTLRILDQDRPLEERRLPPVGYARRVAHFDIVVDFEGSLLEVRPLGDKNKGIGRLLPDRNRSSNVFPLIFADTAKYITGVVGDGVSERHRDAFRAAWDAVIDHNFAALPPEFVAVRKFLANEAAIQGLAANLAQQGGPESPRCCFVVGDVLIHELPEALEFWEFYSTKKERQASRRGVCQITGEEDDILERHNAAARLFPRKNVQLCSANKPSFAHYGHRFAGCAAIGLKAVILYRSALRYLASSENNCLHFAGTTFVWFTQTDPEAVQLQHLFSKAEEEDRSVLATLQAVFNGRPPERSPDSEADLCFAVLTKNETRAIVRDYSKGALPEVLGNLEKWFEALGNEVYTLYQLVRCQVPYTGRPKEDQETFETFTARNPRMLQDLFSRAVWGRRLPNDIGIRLIDRLLLDTEAGSSATRTRLALLRMVLSDGGHWNMKSFGLDPHNRAPCYLAGRLVATLDDISRKAIPYADGLNRKLAVCSRTPGMVIPELHEKALAAHLPKLRGSQKRAWLEKHLRRYLDEIIYLMPHPISALPRHASPDERGLFLLGYHHQRNEIARASKAKGKINARIRELEREDTAGDPERETEIAQELEQLRASRRQFDEKLLYHARALEEDNDN